MSAELNVSRAARGASFATGGRGVAALLAAHPRLALGTLAIFMYVSAEVSIGSVLTNYLMQSHTLGLAALDAGLASTSALSSGMVAAVTVIAIGLCNSIMFPTIFSLAIEGLGLKAARGSGALCLSIVGGAIVPLVTGAAADGFGLSLVLFVPAACLLYVACYGWFARQEVRP